MCFAAPAARDAPCVEPEVSQAAVTPYASAIRLTGPVALDDGVLVRSGGFPCGGLPGWNGARSYLQESSAGTYNGYGRPPIRCVRTAGDGGAGSRSGSRAGRTDRVNVQSTSGTPTVSGHPPLTCSCAARCSPGSAAHTRICEGQPGAGRPRSAWPAAPTPTAPDRDPAGPPVATPRPAAGAAQHRGDGPEGTPAGTARSRRYRTPARRPALRPGTPSPRRPSSRSHPGRPSSRHADSARSDGPAFSSCRSTPPLEQS